jgi:hypothetical protein
MFDVLPSTPLLAAAAAALMIPWQGEIALEPEAQTYRSSLERSHPQYQDRVFTGLTPDQREPRARSLELLVLL